MITYELTRWWAYRRINDPAMRHYVWTIPGAMTAMSILVYYILPIKPEIVGAGGLLEKISTVLTLLPGFFITALAAVSTFNRPEMDETMPEPCPTLAVSYQGKTVNIDLTRRLFLSYLFSYLTIISFILFIATSAAPYVYENILQFYAIINFNILGKILTTTIDIILLSTIIYTIYSIITSALHGIYFLCERIHMPNN